MLCFDNLLDDDLTLMVHGLPRGTTTKARLYLVKETQTSFLSAVSTSGNADLKEAVE